jgi:arsenate reductase (thioredoxin)
MAEAILRKYAGDKFEVFSAGLEPKEINPYTLRVMNEAGYDLAAHYSKPLSLYYAKMQFEYLITVCSDAEKNCPFFPGASIRLHWPFDDPAAFKGSGEMVLGKFREIRDQIEQKIISWLASLDTTG